MSSTLVAVTFDVLDPAETAAFWGSLLGRTVVQESAGALLPGDDLQVGLRFSGSASQKQGRNRLHLHLTSTTLADQQATVSRALSLGAEHLDVGQLPEEE